MLALDALGAQALGRFVEGLQSYQLVCAAGSFAVSGQAAGLMATRSLAVAAGSYAVAGQNARLEQTYPALTASAGSYDVTGQSVGLKLAHRLPAAAGSFSISGQAAGLRYAHRIAAGAGSYTLTGQSVGLRATRKLPMGAGAYTISGQPTTFSVNMPVSAGAYAITGQSATFAVKMSASVGNYAVGGQDAHTLKQFVLHASHLQAPIVTKLHFGFAALGEVGLGQAEIVAQDGGTTYSILGQSAEFRVPRLQAGAGAYAVDGRSAFVLHNRVVHAGGAAYVVTGYETYFGRTSSLARQLISDAPGVSFGEPDGMDAVFIGDPPSYPQLVLPGWN